MKEPKQQAREPHETVKENLKRKKIRIAYIEEKIVSLKRELGCLLSEDKKTYSERKTVQYKERRKEMSGTARLARKTKPPNIIPVWGNKWVLSQDPKIQSRPTQLTEKRS